MSTNTAAAEQTAAIAAIQAGDVDNALERLHRLDRQGYNPVEIGYLIGAALLAKNDHRGARERLLQCESHLPNDPDLNYHLALAHAGDPQPDREAALAYFAKALEARPAFFEAGLQMGMLFEQMSNPDSALAAYIKIAHEIADAKPSEAIIALDRALMLATDTPELLALLGRLHLSVDDAKKAISYYERLLTIQPDNADVHNELGVARYKLNDDAGALKAYKQAIRLRPMFPQARNNMGNVLAKSGKSHEAIKNYRFAVAQFPGYGDAWFNLGKELALIGNTNEALTACERAIECTPGLTLAHSYRANLLLASGQYEQGWPAYERRIESSTGLAYLEDPRAPGASLPLPSSLTVEQLVGQRVLIVAEPTLGDECLFLRFLPMLQALGINVTYQASVKMRPLIQAATNIRLLSGNDDVHEFAAVIASGDCPQFLLRGAGFAPPQPFMLTLPESAIEMASRRLAALGPGPYLGLTWRAGFASDAVMQKRVAPRELAAIASDWPGTVLVFQRDATADEWHEFRDHCSRPSHDMEDLSDDLVALASALSQLDEYVGVSNTNMYIRGSLSRASRVLVKRASEWRWGLGGASTPWEPMARLYREDLSDGWRPALRALARDMASVVSKYPA